MGLGFNQSLDVSLWVLGLVTTHQPPPSWAHPGSLPAQSAERESPGQGSRRLHGHRELTQSGQREALCPFAGSAAAGTDLGCLGDAHSLAPSPGGWRAEISVSAGSFHPEASLLGSQTAAVSLCPQVSLLCAQASLESLPESQSLLLRTPVGLE